MQLTIAIIIGLGVGFGAGRYTAQIRSANGQTQVIALKQPTETPELLAARARLDALLARYTDEHPTVKSMKAEVQALVEKQHAK